MNTGQKTYSINSLRFWSSYLVHMRPYLFFISGVAGLAGMAVYSQFEMGSVRVILSFLAVFFSYGFGQALTDCYQIDTDSISAPYRPLSRGVLVAKTVKIVSITGLIVVIGILIYFNPWNIILGLLGLFGLMAYSFAKRRFWIAGPPLNAIIVSLLAIMGFLSISPDSILWVSGIELFILAGLTFFSYINFVLIGYLKDITADRNTGYNTFPVLFGWNKSVWLGDFNLIICIVLYLMIGTNNPASIILGIMSFIIAISGQLYAHFVKEKTESNSTYPIISTVRSFILMHLAVIVSFNPGMLVFTLIYYLLFEATIYLRPMHSQI